MSDYLNNLVARTMNAATVVRPRLPSMFESDSPAVSTVNRASFETEVPRRDPSPEPTLRVPAAISVNVQAPRVQPRGKEKIEAKALDQKNAAVEPAFRSHEEPAALAGDHLSSLPATARVPAQVADRAASREPDANRMQQKAQGKAAASQATSEPDRLLTNEREGEKNSPQRQPRIRQLAHEQLTRLPLTPPLEGERSEREQSSHVSASSSRMTIKRQDPTAIMPAAGIVRELGVTRESAPTINVTIGRVEVRAIMPPTEQTRQVARAPRIQPTSLDDYLKKRSEGRR